MEWKKLISSPSFLTALGGARPTILDLEFGFPFELEHWVLFLLEENVNYCSIENTFRTTAVSFHGIARQLFKDLNYVILYTLYVIFLRWWALASVRSAGLAYTRWLPPRHSWLSRRRQTVHTWPRIKRRRESHHWAAASHLSRLPQLWQTYSNHLYSCCSRQSFP